MRRWRRIILVAAGVAAGLSSSAAAQSPGAASPGAAETLSRTYTNPGATVSVSLSAGKIFAADRLTLTIRVESEPGLTPTWPQIGDLVGDFRVAGRADTPTQLLASAGGAGRLATERRLTLEPSLPGRHQIPAMEFRFKPISGAETSAAGPFTIATMPMEVEVESLVDEKSTPPDPGVLRGVVGVAPERRPVVWIIAIGTAVATALGVSATAIVRLRRRDGRPVDPIVTLKTRLRRLDEGAAGGTVSQEQFYTELSGIVREYLALTVAIPAPDLTTEELGPRLLAEPRLARHAAGLKVLLARCDMAKFAADRPGGARAREDVRLVETFIADMEMAAAESSREGVAG